MEIYNLSMHACVTNYSKDTSKDNSVFFDAGPAELRLALCNIKQKNPRFRIYETKTIHRSVCVIVACVMYVCRMSITFSESVISPL